MTPTPGKGSSADLTITKTAQVVAKGTQLIYWLTVTNAGPSKAQGLVVTDPLPAPVQYISIAPQTTSGVKCSYAAATSTVTCTFASLGVGKTSKVGILVKVLANSQDFTNCANVSARTSDQNLSNNQSCLTLDANLKPVADTGALSITDAIGWVQSMWQAMLDKFVFPVYSSLTVPCNSE